MANVAEAGVVKRPNAGHAETRMSAMRLIRAEKNPSGVAMKRVAKAVVRKRLAAQAACSRRVVLPRGGKWICCHPLEMFMRVLARGEMSHAAGSAHARPCLRTFACRTARAASSSTRARRCGR